MNKPYVMHHASAIWLEILKQCQSLRGGSLGDTGPFVTVSAESFDYATGDL